MRRRDFLKLSGASTAALTLPASSGLGQPLPDQPNVLFIFLDDLNDWTGYLGGHPQALTPNIDALAASGMAFTNAHVNAVACVPSRTSVLSGLRPSSTGVYRNSQDWTDYIPDHLMMPANFMQNGYTTLRAGKIFHPSEFSVFWDEYTAWYSIARPANFPASSVDYIGVYSSHFDWAQVDVSVKATRDYRWAEWAVNKLTDGELAGPFFLGVGLTALHDPWYIPRECFEPFPLESIVLPDVPEDELDDIPQYAINHLMSSPEYHENVVGQQQWRKVVQAYLAAMYLCDLQIGRILDALESSPFADDTIVVLSSDHGLHLGEKFNWRKFCLWREDTHVPLIWRVPGMTQAGSVYHHATELIDIYPTLVDLCGLDNIPNVEGQSIRPILENPQQALNRPAITTANYLVHAVRDDRWRFIQYPNGSRELYDHDVDPREHANLAGNPDYADIIDTLSGWLPDVNIEP